MRTSLISLIALVGFYSSPGFAEPSTQEIGKAKTFIERNASCVLAVATPADSNSIISPIFCIWDGVYNQGTINEGTSCMLGSIDLMTGAYGSFPGYVGVNSNETLNKKCTRELVDSILHKIPMEHFHPGMGSAPFEKMIRKEEPKIVVLFDKYKLWSKSFSPEKKSQLPTGYKDVKFGIKFSDLSAMKKCGLKKIQSIAPELKGVAGYNCKDFDYEDRKVEAEFYFKNDKLLRIVLGVGLQQSDDRSLIRDDLNNYMNQINSTYGDPQEANPNELLEVLTGKKSKMDFAWNKKTVLLRLWRNDEGQFGADMIFSSPEYYAGQ
jgi:hypothetical protein